MKTQHRQLGFSLAEVLIVAPIVILVIATFVVFIVTITGEVIKTKASIDTLDDTQTGLNYIKADVRLSTAFASTTGQVATPQGANDDTAAWTNSGSSTNTLILTRLGTTINPINPAATDPTNGIVYTNTPYGCTSGEREQNPPFTYYSVYFLKTVGGVQSLWQRNIMKGYPTIITSNTCTTPWQLPSCTPSLVGTQTVCVTADTQVAKNVQTFSVEYYNSAGTLTTTRSDTTNIKITLTTSQTVAGQSQTSSDDLRVAKRGSEVPAAAYITESVSWTPCSMQNGWTEYTGFSPIGVTKTATGAVVMSGLFMKTTTPTADAAMCTLPAGYRPAKRLIFQVAGGGGAARVDVLTNGEVRYETGGGSSNPWWVAATGVSFLASDVAPDGSWTNLTAYPPGGWVSYDSGVTFALPSVIKDSSGRAWIRGLAKSGSTVVNSVAYTLPAGYPIGSGECLMYPAMTNPNVSGSMAPTGSNITFRYGSNGYWSLQAMFYPIGSAIWNEPVLQNSWTPYGYCWGGVGYTKNTDGIVSLRGLISGGSTSGTIFTLPVGHRPTRTDVYCAVNTYNATPTDAQAVLVVQPSGNVVISSGVSSTWLSLSGCNFVAEQ